MIRPRIVALLGLASGLDYAAQVLVPILLVRVLSAHDFGGYRLLWLAAQTCANILSMSVAAFLSSRCRNSRPPARCPVRQRLCLPCSHCPAGRLGAQSLTPLVQRMYAGGAVDAWLPPLFSALWLVSLPWITSHWPVTARPTRRC